MNAIRQVVGEKSQSLLRQRILPDDAVAEPPDPASVVSIASSSANTSGRMVNMVGSRNEAAGLNRFFVSEYFRT